MPQYLDQNCKISRDPWSFMVYLADFCQVSQIYLDPLAVQYRSVGFRDNVKFMEYIMWTFQMMLRNTAMKCNSLPRKNANSAVPLQVWYTRKRILGVPRSLTSRTMSTTNSWYVAGNLDLTEDQAPNTRPDRMRVIPIFRFNILLRWGICLCYLFFSWPSLLKARLRWRINNINKCTTFGENHTNDAISCFSDVAPQGKIMV